ncbi:hypothetical protein DDV96_02835 [Marixanthomonas spongiae]|uniref:YtkA-like domain-containing protein n=2 Tax=Marixanthomonas spongiae TaxID=2174845 RepID=A0A2U0I540_9FLAO|nr:hypothetical protein DDV96_02835 [Marixanthomonas spongiae]
MTCISCSKDDADDNTEVEENPMEDFSLLKEFDYDEHTLEVYSENNTQFEIGYTPLYMRIKDKVSEKYVENADLSLKPMMHMENMMHSSPVSPVVATDNPTVYTGYVVFQMPGNATEYWDITFNYSLNGTEFSKTERIDVVAPADGLKRVNTFMGTDETRYVLAYVGPVAPQVALNDMTAVLHKMETMMEFPVVEGYTVEIDPRMPGMGNHSSPNNVDLSYNGQTQMYAGKLSLSMTGYWKINMKLVDDEGAVLKGEDVTDENPESSLYFEIEF